MKHPNFLAIARVCHEVNRAYCEAIGEPLQVSWDEAPIRQQSSCITGVTFLYLNPDAGPEAMHTAWLQQKAADGWTYGPVTNPDLKEHPCVLPWDKLPDEQRIKDHLFRAIVLSMLADGGA